jgi:hypothetical protein
MLQLSVLDKACPGVHKGVGTQRGPGRIVKKDVTMKALKDLWAMKESFIFPINWNDDHWFVVRGNRAKSSWEVYNSIADPVATRCVMEVKLFSVIV